jgi:hypothetical protein
MTTREEKIEVLTDQQALSIVDSLAGEFASDDTPEGKELQELQTEGLQALVVQAGQDLDVSQAARADVKTAAIAARRLLSIMAQIPEMHSSLDEWLDHPPTQETAAIPLVLAAPVILTGCIVVLQVAGHVKIKRGRNGKWEIEIDPSTETALDKIMKDIITTLASLIVQ